MKRLDLIDRVPEELWMEVPDIAQEAEIKTIPKKKKCKKAKWLSEEGLQIAVNRREVKGKGEIRKPGKSHGRRSLVGYSPWYHKQSDTKIFPWYLQFS